MSVASKGKRGDQYTAKATPVNADKITIFDSEDVDSSGRLKTKTVELGSLPCGVGGILPLVWDIPAGSVDYPSTNYAPWTRIVGSNGDYFAQEFSNLTEEFVLAKVTVPDTVSFISTDLITFKIRGFAKTADGNNINVKVYHSAKGDGENWDTAYDSFTSGDMLTDSTQDQLDFLEFTETWGNLGWSAGDEVRLKISLVSTTGIQIGDMYYMTSFRVEG